MPGPLLTTAVGGVGLPQEPQLDDTGLLGETRESSAVYTAMWDMAVPGAFAEAT